MTAGQTIKQIRRKQKITQLELANRLQLTQSALSHYESDKRKISIDLIKHITTALGITMNDFFATMDS